MKKIKLITSISTIGAIACATPIVATSCSKNEDIKTATISDLIWLGETLTPTVDNESVLMGGTLKDGDTELDTTLVKNITDNGSDSTLNVKEETVSLGNLEKTISITPSWTGEKSLKLKFEIYKNNDTKETTFYTVDTTVKVIEEPIITYEINASKGNLVNCTWEQHVGLTEGAIQFAYNAKLNGASGVMLTTTNLPNAEYKFYDVSATELLGISYDPTTGINFTPSAVNTITKKMTLIITAFDSESEEPKAMTAITIKPVPIYSISGAADATSAFGGIKGNLVNGNSLFYQLKNGNKATFTLNENVTLNEAPKWELLKAYDPMTQGFTLTPNGNSVTLTIDDQSKFTQNSSYAIVVTGFTTNEIIASFVFKTPSIAFTGEFKAKDPGTPMPMDVSKSEDALLGYARFKDQYGDYIVGASKGELWDSTKKATYGTITLKWYIDEISKHPAKKAISYNAMNPSWDEEFKLWYIAIPASAMPTIKAEGSDINGCQSTVIVWTLRDGETKPKISCLAWEEVDVSGAG